MTCIPIQTLQSTQQHLLRCHNKRMHCYEHVPTRRAHASYSLSQICVDRHCHTMMENISRQHNISPHEKSGAGRDTFLYPSAASAARSASIRSFVMELTPRAFLRFNRCGEQVGPANAISFAGKCVLTSHSASVSDAISFSLARDADP